MIHTLPIVFIQTFRNLRIFVKRFKISLGKDRISSALVFGQIPSKITGNRELKTRDFSKIYRLK